MAKTYIETVYSFGYIPNVIALKLFACVPSQYACIERLRW